MPKGLTLREAHVAQLEALSKHLPEETKGNHEIHMFGLPFLCQNFNSGSRNYDTGLLSVTPRGAFGRDISDL